ncbi:MAG: rod-binding protein [Lachnospiraceae bacterium]|nr:rod-binding protein [Lachnospiraceae bacterium]
MSISIGSDYLNMYNAQAKASESKSAADKISSKLNNLEGATDEEMLEACKDFEAYFVEKVIKMMHESVKSEEEEENPYLQQFGDMRYQEYAKKITESGQLGVAQKLYEAMKRNGNG